MSFVFPFVDPTEGLLAVRVPDVDPVLAPSYVFPGLPVGVPVSAPVELPGGSAADVFPVYP